ncbi:MAG TPA: 4Fe-4S binding protein [Mycobacteriales bacterium]|nr:4Fe-4S binding protein [Mycobacteriales bacterium]
MSEFEVRLEAAAEERPQPAGRGVIALDEGSCTVCMICVRECPDWCILIEGHQEATPQPAGRRRQVRNVLDRFAIDFSLCMYCGICIEACPFDALFWSPEYAYPAALLGDLTHELPQLRDWMGTVPAAPGGALPSEAAESGS